MANVYDDARRATAYAALGFPGTYWLAFRDLPAIIARHVPSGRALDFGCGTGRSSIFLRSLGFAVIGVDISPSMISRASSADAAGAYQLIEDGDLSAFRAASFDLILSAFAFDNIPDAGKRTGLLAGLAALLKVSGNMVLLGSSAQIYVHEWASFTTRDFPQNRLAGSGDAVGIIIKEGADQRPVTDFLWTDDDYRRQFRAAGLELLESHRPLGREGEPTEWQAERSISPWVIYVLRRGDAGGRRAFADD